jgi:hypothetical protein
VQCYLFLRDQIADIQKKIQRKREKERKEKKKKGEDIYG